MKTSSQSSRLITTSHQRSTGVNQGVIQRLAGPLCPGHSAVLPRPFRCFGQDGGPPTSVQSDAHILRRQTRPEIPASPVGEICIGRGCDGVEPRAPQLLLGGGAPTAPPPGRVLGCDWVSRLRSPRGSEESSEGQRHQPPETMLAFYSCELFVSST